MEMKDMTLEIFCATIVSNEPASGGGSVSTLAGALAAALMGTVAQLVIGKEGYEKAVDEMKAIILEAAALYMELLDEITRDSTPLNAYMEVMILSKDIDEQKEVRRNAMQEALKRAAEVSPYAAVTAAKITPMAGTMVKKGNANVVTDGMVAAMMTHTAVLGAPLNVKTNLGSTKDEAYVVDMKAKIHEVEIAIVRDEAAVLATSSLK